MDESFDVGEWFQGPTGSGQGGWTASRFARQLPTRATMALRAPIPLATPLFVVKEADQWLLATPDHEGGDTTTVMIATRRSPLSVETSPVGIEQAQVARGGFRIDDHPVPLCFSCGTGADAMGVHAGPLGSGDDRFATDWTAPRWASRHDGTVDDGVVWAALDCTAAWYVCRSRAERNAVTVQFAADVRAPVVAGATYAVVGWSGDGAGEWDGRKRSAASAVFADDGTCVAVSTSLWLSLPA